MFRLARPKDKEARGLGGNGRVMGAWRFSTRPVLLTARTTRVTPRTEMAASTLVVVGDDHMRTALRATVQVARAPVGGLAFSLPGDDDVRSVHTPKLESWWLEGTGDARVLRVRFQDLVQGAIPVAVTLSRRLGGVREGLNVPRWSLQGAHRDRCQIVLYALRDTEPVPGALPGLQPVPLTHARIPKPPLAQSRPTHVFQRERPLTASLPLVLRTPALSAQAAVVSLVTPGEHEHEVEHLVLYEVERGSTDHLQIFVPDGGAAAMDVIRTRDLREQRARFATRSGSDGQEVQGTLHDVLLQSPQSGVIALTVTQRVRAGRPVRSIRPENIHPVRWFSLVRTYLDGQVTAQPAGGDPDPVAWEDLPFVPAGVSRQVIVRSDMGRDPFALSVRTTRHAFSAQADAVVLSADAHVVVGRDGHARVRCNYRVFNRARQFLRLRLPTGAVLFGASSAGAPVKPLAGAGGTLLLPVPKVPLGALGHPVTVLFRMRVGEHLRKQSSLKLLLPTMEGVGIDRTVVRLHVPQDYEYDFETTMTASEADDVAQDLVEASIRECRALLDIAETGTLPQRVAAGANGNWLLQQAKSLNRPKNARGRTLAADIAQLETELRRKQAQTAQDQQSVAQLSLNPSQEEFGGNAAQVIGMDQAEEDERAAAFAGRAGWYFNDSDGDDRDVAGRVENEFTKMKKRMRHELEQQLDSSTRLGKVASQPQGGKDAGGTAPVAVASGCPTSTSSSWIG